MVREFMRTERRLATGEVVDGSGDRVKVQRDLCRLALHARLHTAHVSGGTRGCTVHWSRGPLQEERQRLGPMPENSGARLPPGHDLDGYTYRGEPFESVGEDVIARANDDTAEVAGLHRPRGGLEQRQVGAVLALPPDVAGPRPHGADRERVTPKWARGDDDVIALDERGRVLVRADRPADLELVTGRRIAQQVVDVDEVQRPRRPGHRHIALLLHPPCTARV